MADLDLSVLILSQTNFGNPNQIKDILTSLINLDLSQTNFRNPNQIKDILTSIINRIEQQDNIISYLKSENDHWLSENSLIKDKVLKLERYSSN